MKDKFDELVKNMAQSVQAVLVQVLERRRQRQADLAALAKGQLAVSFQFVAEGAGRVRMGSAEW